MTKFNNQEEISNHQNWTCINPKLNSNKPILCFKSGMHQTEAEGQKPVSGIMQLVKMQKGILSGKRHNAKRHNANGYNASREIISGHRKELGMRDGRTTRHSYVLVSTLRRWCARGRNILLPLRMSWLNI